MIFWFIDFIPVKKWVEKQSNKSFGVEAQDVARKVRDDQIKMLTILLQQLSTKKIHLFTREFDLNLPLDVII